MNDPAHWLQAAFEHQRAGQLADAEAAYRQVVELHAPETLDAAVLACLNLASLAEQRGAGDEARRHYALALQLQPALPELLVNRGIELQQAGDPQGAIELYERALRIQPGWVRARFARATAAKRLLRMDQAVADYQALLRAQPGHVDACNNLAVIYHETGRPEEAIAACRQGLTAAPDSPALHANLAIALHMLGRADEALAAYQRVVELRPDSPADQSNLLYAMNYHPAFDAETIFAEHCRWAERHANRLSDGAPVCTVDRTSERRLRVGYVSPYFRTHAVSAFVEPLLAAHDHAVVEVLCYADQWQQDATTQRLRRAADQWRDVVSLSDDALARLVRDDQVDILVDLTGHIGGNRLLTFARRPAPVQVTYLGYQATTGMQAIDYRLTDAWADPPGQTERWHTEQLIRLPRAFFCYQPADVAPDVTPLPAVHAGQVTFGSFNNFAKVTPAVLDTWCEVLQRVPRSRLLLLAQRAETLRTELDQRARRHGIAAQRIELCDKRPMEEYLRLIQTVDIALDPFPMNGHTTTCDALWMGVPVVMLAGTTYATRFGGSALRNLGLEHLIATSVREYVAVAVKLASDLPALAALREQLRPRMAASALLDFQGFARHVEAAYRTMWRNWCQRPTAPA